MKINESFFFYKMNETDDIKKPSKRGRKKKEVVETEQEPKIKKKRGRKAALKFFSSSIRKKIPISSNSNSTSNVILQLDITEQDQDQDQEECSLSLLGFSEEPTQYSSIKTVEVEVPPPQIQERRQGYITVLESDTHNTIWPLKTDVYCWWCCHSFDSVPVGLPVEFNFIKDRQRNLFKVKGNFCSIACVLAWYNHSKYNQSGKIFNLIKLLNKKLTGSDGYSQKLIPSPPRESLKIFGGELSIKEFREKSDNGFIYNLIEYPMIIIKEFIEEIDLTNLKLQNETTIETYDTGPKKNLENLIQNAKTRISTKDQKESTENTIDKFLKLKLT